MPGHRAEADRARRGRGVLPESQRGRGDGLWRGQGRLGHQRDRRPPETAPAEAGITLPVHVEINMGGNRCGVEPGEPALALARRIGDAPHLTFAGLQAYHGSAQHLRTWEERQKAIAGAVEKAVVTRDLLAANGIPCDNITGAGTGT